MRYITSKFSKLWNRDGKRRRGSVLILVVVLVVLLALMGTALLSTTQADRYVAAQHTANTQIDLLIDGVVQITKATIAEDLYGPYPSNGNRTFRPPWDTSSTGTFTPGTDAYENWDMPFNSVTITAENDIWLAPRIPSVVTTSTAITNLAWSSITTLPGFTTFDSPIALNALTGEASLALKTTYQDRVSAPPRFLTPTYANIDGVRPAWVLPVGPGVSVPRFVLAADADGDGVADSGFFKLPVGELEGITYYAAVRIIDNNSAVNVNTAFSRTGDLDFAQGTFSDSFGTIVTSTSTYNDLGAFPSHVGLFELVKNPGVDMTAILNYRNSSTQLTKAPVNDPDTTTHLNTAWPSNFEYVSYGDAWTNQVANRLYNPGYLTAGPTATATRFKAFSHSDASALARHFMLPVMSSPSLLELNVQTESKSQSLLDSIFRSAPNSLDSSGTTSSARGGNAYPSSSRGIADWYSDNFNFDDYSGNVSVQGGASYPVAARPSTYVRPIRSLLTTDNPTSTQIPMRALPSDPVMALAPYRNNTTTPKGSPTKTNVNTAPLEELYRAYWSVMSEGTLGSGTGTPFVATGSISSATNADAIYQGMDFAPKYPFAPSLIQTDINPQHMFRSSIRVPGGGALTYFEPEAQLRLRAHAAAIQTMQWRDPARTQIKNVLPLPAKQGGAQVTFNVNTFGNTPQPFITEVFAWYDPTVTDPSGMNANTLPYVAIELFNPYNTPITLNGTYKIYALERDAGTWILPLASMPTPVFTFSGQQILANDYLVIDNRGAEVKFEPSSAQVSAPILTAGPKVVSDPRLTDVLDKELVIVQDLGGAGTPNTLKPIDSYDFKGFPHQDALTPGSLGMAWHYSRATSGTIGEKRWHCVYPGRYDGRKGADQDSPRQQGTEVETWSIPPGGGDPWASSVPSSGVKITLGMPNEVSSYPSTFAIPLGDVNWPGPNPVGGGTNKWPFGGFAREGDILEVPFIAAYTITDASGQLIEINSISMDAAFAEDSDPRDDFPLYNLTTQVPLTPDPILPREQVGRFCPLPKMMDSGSAVLVADDFDDTTKDTFATPHPYSWARDLFDYLTVRTPASDYFPNASPLIYPSPIPVDNDGVDGAGEASPSPNAGKEDALGVQGLININTAPWKVLSAIPWMPANGSLPNSDLFTFNETTGDFTLASNNVDDNIDIAKAIVFWRDGNPLASIAGKGPFKSIFDLYNVTNPQGSNHNYVFQFIQDTMGKIAPPGRAEGYLTPRTGTSDPAHDSRNDFQEQYRLLTKVSNLLTTRSDSFTVYILVQGWRGIGTDTPTMAVQRRVAFIQDRSSVTASNPTLPASVNVPND